jgi:hypothetical protein
MISRRRKYYDYYLCDIGRVYTDMWDADTQIYYNRNQTMIRRSKLESEGYAPHDII